MSYKKQKPRFFKDDNKRTRVIGNACSNPEPTFLSPSRVSATQTHEQRIIQRLQDIPRQQVKSTKRGIDVEVPQRTVELRLIQAEDKDVVITPREGETQQQLDKRSQHFVEVYRRGGLIPPPLLHQLPDGKFEVVDGKARANAYRMLKVQSYPANENGILSDIGKGFANAVRGGAKLAGEAIGTGVASAKNQYHATKAEASASVAEHKTSAILKKRQLSSQLSDQLATEGNDLKNIVTSVRKGLHGFKESGIKKVELTKKEVEAQLAEKKAELAERRLQSIQSANARIKDAKLRRQAAIKELHPRKRKRRVATQAQQSFWS
jgi:hypothetical protein